MLNGEDRNVNRTGRLSLPAKSSWLYEKAGAEYDTYRREREPPIDLLMAMWNARFGTRSRRRSMWPRVALNWEDNWASLCLKLVPIGLPPNCTPRRMSGSSLWLTAWLGLSYTCLVPSFEPRYAPGTIRSSFEPKHTTGKAADESCDNPALTRP
jgi:hypothetical protein